MTKNTMTKFPKMDTRFFMQRNHEGGFWEVCYREFGKGQKKQVLIQTASLERAKFLYADFQALNAEIGFLAVKSYALKIETGGFLYGQ